MATPDEVRHMLPLGCGLLHARAMTVVRMILRNYSTCQGISHRPAECRLDAFGQCSKLKVPRQVISNLLGVGGGGPENSEGGMGTG